MPLRVLRVTWRKVWLLAAGFGLGVSASEYQLVAENPLIEADENRSRVALSVRLDSGLNPAPVTVRFTAVGGTARQGIDYTLDEPTLVLDPYVPWGMVLLTLLSDGVVEPTRSLLIDATIEGSTNEPTRIEVLINDGDSPGKVGFISPRFCVNEAVPQAYAEIAFFRTQDVKQTAVVRCRLDGEDLGRFLVEGTNVLTARFEAGDSRAYLRIPLVNDSLQQGDRDVRLSIVTAETTLEPIPELTGALLTVADDDVLRVGAPLSIRDWVMDGIRGVQITSSVPRGFQQRIEYSETGLEGPWQILTVLLGQEGETLAFDSYEESFGMRMYRAVPVEPLELTLPW